MNWKKKIKSDAIEKIDQAVPSEMTSPLKPRVKKWVGFGLGAVGLAAVAIAAPIVIVNSTTGSGNSDNLENALRLQGIRPTCEERQVVSLSSVEVYESFYRNFVPILFQGSTSSVSFSVFDAFVNFAANAYFSEGEIQTSLLKLFDNAPLGDIAKSVKELTLALGTPYKSKYSSSSRPEGGYSANSLWADPSVLTFKDGPELDVAAEDFYLSLLDKRPSTDALKKWLEEVLPAGFEAPEIAPSPADAMLVSSYFLKRHNPNYYTDLTAYLNGDRMDYTYLGQKRKSGYVHYGSNYGEYYESDVLIGGTNPHFGLSVYLPKDDSASPDSILLDVVEEKYETHTIHNVYEVNIPYFTIKTSGAGLDLLKPARQFVGSPLSGGALGKLFSMPIYLDSIRQHSRVNFDYAGFTNESVTIASYSTGMPQEGETFYLDVDRPFVFVDAWQVKMDKTFITLPLVVGEVFDLGYKKA